MIKIFVHKQIIFTTIILLLFICGCRKHKYEACFTINKSTAHVDDTLSFSNCSKEDGNPYLNYSIWDFGDGSSAYWSKGSELVQHNYHQAGQYTVKLTIGEKENGSEQQMIITIQ
jgi:PKD repeat protein